MAETCECGKLAFKKHKYYLGTYCYGCFIKLNGKKMVMRNA